MEQARLQKIQTLVQVSQMLAPAEKNEWLGLLGLMNDRQLLELERILVNVDNSRVLKTNADTRADQASIDRKNKTNTTDRVAPEKAVIAPAQFSTLGGANNQKPQNRGVPDQQQNIPKIGTGFSHILNFPKAGAVPFAKPAVPPVKQAAAPKPVTPPPVAPVQSPQIETKTVEAKKPSPFLAKLKGILGEKELPAPVRPALADHQEMPKKPLATVQQKSAVPARPTLAPAPKPTPPIEQVQKVVQKPVEQPKPAPVPAPQPQNVTINLIVDSSPKAVVPPVSDLSSIIAQAQASAATVPKREAPRINVAAPGPLRQEPVVLPARPRVEYNESPAPEVTVTVAAPEQKQDMAAILKPLIANAQSMVSPGLTIPEFSREQMLKDKGSTASVSATFDKFGSNKTAENFKAVIQEKTGDDMKLETLSDVVALKPSDMQQHATGTILRKLQKLIVQYGLHEVSFNLEKSALYKAYVNTGISLLKDSAASKTDLSRRDFEQFADLLIVTRSKF